MKLATLRTFTCALITSIGIAAPVTLAAADQQFAIAQFDNGRGIKIVVLMGFKAAECKKLIDTFEAGLKLDCPTCRRDYGGCTTDLGGYRPVWLNQRYPAPYFSAGNHRYIYLGMTRTEANVICQDTVTRFRANGKEARCVM